MGNIDFDEGREKHSQRVRRMGDHKKRTRRMAGYVAGSAEDDRARKLAAELYDCHSYLCFHDHYEEGTIRLHRTISCRKSLLCPLCAILRAAKGVQRSHERVAVVKGAKPSLRMYYVVPTVLNGECLPERFNHLQQCARRLIERARMARRARKGDARKAGALSSAMANVDGGAYSFEVKRGSGSGEWHPHVNMLLLVDGELDIERLREEWREITGDSCNIYCEEKSADDLTAFVEVFKYAFKFSEMELDDNYHAYETLRGRRLVGSFGSLWGVHVPEDEECELTSPYVELVYRFIQGKYRPVALDRESLHRRDDGGEGIGRGEGGAARSSADRALEYRMIRQRLVMELAGVSGEGVPFMGVSGEACDLVGVGGARPREVLPDSRIIADESG
jgi:hypothetical protein